MLKLHVLVSLFQVPENVCKKIEKNFNVLLKLRKIFVIEINKILMCNVSVKPVWPTCIFSSYFRLKSKIYIYFFNCHSSFIILLENIFSCSLIQNKSNQKCLTLVNRCLQGWILFIQREVPLTLISSLRQLEAVNSNLLPLDHQRWLFCWFFSSIYLDIRFYRLSQN